MFTKLLDGIALVTVSLLSAGSARAAITIVTPATLQSAFAAASAGDTLRLVGTFGYARLQNRSFAKAVTLDATHATFTDTLILQNDGNLKLSRGQYNIAGGSSYNAAIDVWGGSNIIVDRATIAGSGSEVGINFEGTSNATATNGVFDGLHAAISLGSVTGGTASYNRVTHAGADGIDIGDSHFVTAMGNACSLNTPSPGAHADCIQLWSVTGHALESDITVTRNTATGPMQGFTSFSAGGGALRVAITHNTVNTSDPQGVACYACIDSNISYNSISTLPGAQYKTGLSIVGGRNNIVVGNNVHGRPTTNAMSAVARTFNPMFGTASPAAVPEPTTWAMLVAGFGAVGLARRRRSARAGLAA